MSKAVSFTEGNAVRYPVPDVARGFMLLLIALANIGVWASIIPSQVQNTRLDVIFTVLRVGLIDQRAYPLFSMLFGFGLMVMVQRRRANYMAKATASLATLDPSSTSPAFIAAQEQSFLAAASIDARHLLRRRGWWMLLFGAVHALIFPGDIIGTYAVVALIFAGMIVAEKSRTMIIIGLFPMIIGAIAIAGKAYLPEDTQSGGLMSLEYTPLTPFIHVGTWAVMSVMGLAFSTVIVAAGIGAHLATTDFLIHPERHRRFLALSALIGLLSAFLLGLPEGLAQADLLADGVQGWMLTLAALGSVPGAWGWLSLIALLTGPAPTTGGLRGIRWLLSAVGRRSMTAYLLQTLVFLVIFQVVNVLGWPVSETANVLFAWAAWLCIAALCVTLEFAGKRGPFEVLLRSAVASTAKPVPVPPVTLPPAVPAMQGMPLGVGGSPAAAYPGAAYPGGASGAQMPQPGPAGAEVTQRVPVIPRPYPQPGRGEAQMAYPMTPPMGEQMPPPAQRAMPSSGAAMPPAAHTAPPASALQAAPPAPQAEDSGAAQELSAGQMPPANTPEEQGPGTWAKPL